MGFVCSLAIGSVVGCIAGFMTKKGENMGILANIFAGIIGSCAGYSVFGLCVFDISYLMVLPSIIGAIILIAIMWHFSEN